MPSSASTVLEMLTAAELCPGLDHVEVACGVYEKIRMRQIELTEVKSYPCTNIKKHTEHQTCNTPLNKANSFRENKIKSWVLPYIKS